MHPGFYTPSACAEVRNKVIIPTRGVCLKTTLKKTRIMKQAKTVSTSFMLMGILFCVCLITSNLLETKVFKLYGQINLTCGFLVFPISYILNDCIAEVWGYRKSRLIIWAGFLMNFFVVALGAVASILPPINEGDDASFRSVFLFAPQVTVASFLAFIVGSFLNALVMSKMKLADRNKGHFNYYFSLRAILSTVVGECADSVIFFPLAFYIFPLIFSGQPAVTIQVLVGLMLTQVVAKTLYEVIALPVTIKVVRFVKKYEQTDVYDENISYNAFKIKDI